MKGLFVQECSSPSVSATIRRKRRRVHDLRVHRPGLVVLETEAMNSPPFESTDSANVLNTLMSKYWGTEEHSPANSPFSYTFCTHARLYLPWFIRGDPVHTVTEVEEHLWVRQRLSRSLHVCVGLFRLSFYTRTDKTRRFGEVTGLRPVSSSVERLHPWNDPRCSFDREESTLVQLHVFQLIHLVDFV